MALKKIVLYFILPFILMIFLTLQFNQYKKKSIFIDFYVNDFSEIVFSVQQMFLLNYDNFNISEKFVTENIVFSQLVNSIENYSFNSFETYNFDNDFSQFEKIIINTDRKNKKMLVNIIFKKTLSEQLFDDFMTNFSQKINDEEALQKLLLTNYLISYKKNFDFNSGKKNDDLDEFYNNSLKIIEKFKISNFKIILERNISLIKLFIYIFTSIFIYCLYFFLITNSTFNLIINKNFREFLKFDN
jgi:hypothetical protein